MQTHGIIKPKIDLFNKINTIRKSKQMNWDEFLEKSVIAFEREEIVKERLLVSDFSEQPVAINGTLIDG